MKCAACNHGSNEHGDRPPRPCFHQDVLTKALAVTYDCECPAFTEREDTDATDALSEALGDDADDDAGGLA